jgi:membrane protease YdiL (CAAX protease family)
VTAVDPAPERAAATLLARWLLAFILANLASAVVVSVAGHAGSSPADIPIWVFGLAAVAMWSAQLWVVARALDAEGVGFMVGTSFQFRVRDLAGVPLGIASQVLLVAAVMWPLSRLFPGTFDPDRVAERADDLVSSASGGWMVVLVGIVVVGAPLVEEIVYRGWLQPRLGAVWGTPVGTGAVAVLFAAVHLQPVEFPGLLAFALVLGVARARSGRLGLPVVAHAAFNATGLLLVAM